VSAWLGVTAASAVRCAATCSARMVRRIRTFSTACAHFAAGA
jgi:hypothetical protein